MYKIKYRSISKQNKNKLSYLAKETKYDRLSRLQEI